MDDFKKHLRDKRYWLDTEEPSERVWENIRREGQSIPARFMIFRWAAAACLLLLIGSGIYLLVKQNNHPADLVFIPPSYEIKKHEEKPAQEDPDNYKPAAEPLLMVNNHLHSKPKPGSIKKGPADTNSNTEALAAGFNQLEKTYSSVVDLQMDKIKNTPVYGENASYFSFFQTQLRGLGSDEQNVKRDIKRSGLNNEQIEAMINIYQQKISILKQLQREINKTNNKVKKSNPNVTKPSYITF
jgi:hypothetical protein